MAGDHETAWAKGLAQEQAHQRELLATVRGEIGAFARECAAALTALDGCVGGLGDVVAAIQAGTETHQRATTVVDVGRRFRQLRANPEEDEDSSLYGELGGDGNLSDRAVGHAKRVLAEDPKRSDRELLQAVVQAAGARAQMEAVLGPAPVAALAALAPLSRWMPGLARTDEQEAEPASKTLAAALEAAGTGGGDLVDVAAAAGLADSMREAAAHAGAAAKAVEEGKLRQVVREARKTLGEDVDGLRDVVKRAEEAAGDWVEAREQDVVELAAEVEAKLDRLERMGAWLQQIVPRLQLTSRALSAAEKARTLEGQVDPDQPVTAEAARVYLLLGLGSVWHPLLGPGGAAGAGGAEPRAERGAAMAPPPGGGSGRPSNKLLIGAGAALLIAAGVGIGIWAASSGGGGGSTAAQSTTAPSTTLPTTAPTTTATTAPTTTATTTTTPTGPSPTFEVMLKDGGPGQVVLVYHANIPIARIDYEGKGSKTSPGKKGCTATPSYPGRVMHCPGHRHKSGSIPFYPEPLKLPVKGKATFTGTDGRTYGPIPVSLG